MPTYTATVELVPRDRTVVRLPVMERLAVRPLLDIEEPADLTATVVDVPLYPWVCENGAHGYAGWALVGEALRGFVREGDDAGLVRFDLAARLDLLLWQLQHSGQHGLEIVRDMEKADQERGKRRLDEAGKAMLTYMRDLVWTGSGS